MQGTATPLEAHQQALRTGQCTVVDIAANSLERANGNTSRNTYLHLSPETLAREARELDHSTNDGPLHGIPVSLKDCFDLAGTVTTAGTRFYAEHNQPAAEDSFVAERLRTLGCLITGKTHLHPLAYGITGENPDYGDCLQPRNPLRLTGGSSSGAAASIQERSALIAVGTDTGGSIRVPSALCGLAGYRASHNITARWPQLWRGGIHLAPSFDTLGFIAESAADLATFATNFFDLPTKEVHCRPRVGTVPTAFLAQVDSAVFVAFAAWQDACSEAGCDLVTFSTEAWKDSFRIFAPIQAHEAAAIHAGNFDHFEASIAERLHWGASLSDAEVASWRGQHEAFRAALAEHFTHFDFLIVPAAPVHELRAGTDLSEARPRILEYTTPFSLGGNPVVTLPGTLLGETRGTGIQIAAAPGNDAALLTFASNLASSAISAPHALSHGDHA